MTFAEKVKFARKKIGMTQTQFAKALGVSYASINRWENSQVVPCTLAKKVFKDFCESNFIYFN